MKVRYDFVTNSSSSSFIFGEPGGHKLKVEDVVTLIKDLAKKLVAVTDQLDSLIKADKYLYTLVEEYKNATSYERKYELEDKIEETWVIETIKAQLKEQKIIDDTDNTDDTNDTYDIVVVDGIDDTELAEDILMIYLGNYSGELEKIKEIAESTDKYSLPIKSEIIDLRKDSSIVSEYAEDIIGWYEYEDECKDIKDKMLKDKESLTAQQIAHKYFGEIAIMGECGYIPDLIVTLLYDKVKFGCNHMG